jgi:hypothetical protein
MSVRLMAVGDMALRTEPEGLDPFEFVASTLGAADVVFGNLEVPLTSRREPAVEKAEPLRAPVGEASRLRSSGVSVVNLANNHIQDYGPAAVYETIDALERAGVRFVGVGPTLEGALREAVVPVRGVEIAFVGFFEHGESKPGGPVHVAGMNPQLVLHRVAALAQSHRFVVVSLHWGIENVYYPSPEQQSLARVCVEAGAALVLGHHSHRFQGVEVYRGRPIVYSLGNFNFMTSAGAADPMADFTAVADVVFREDGTIGYDLAPMRIGGDLRPRPVTDPVEAARFQAHIERISRVLPPGIDRWWWYGEIAGPYLVGNAKAYWKRIRTYGFGHAIEMARWLTRRFTVKCCVALLRRLVRRGDRGGNGHICRHACD